MHLYGFKDEKLFQLIESPTELLTAIYNHECLLKPQKRDINKLAAELANLYKINLSSVQLRLLQKWLAFAPIDQDHQELNETVYEDFITTAQDPGLFELICINLDSIFKNPFIF